MGLHARTAVARLPYSQGLG